LAGASAGGISFFGMVFPVPLRPRIHAGWDDQLAAKSTRSRKISPGSLRILALFAPLFSVAWARLRLRCAKPYRCRRLPRITRMPRISEGRFSRTSWNHAKGALVEAGSFAPIRGDSRANECFGSYEALYRVRRHRVFRHVAARIHSLALAATGRRFGI
jgi:hypothetical protein